MPVSVHVVYLQVMTIDPLTNGVAAPGGNKSDPNFSYKKTLSFYSEPRVIADSSVASSTSNPTIKNYLIAEAALGYRLIHLDNTMIITELVS